MHRICYAVHYQRSVGRFNHSLKAILIAGATIKYKTSLITVINITTVSLITVAQDRDGRILLFIFTFFRGLLQGQTFKYKDHKLSTIEDEQDDWIVTNLVKLTPVQLFSNLLMSHVYITAVEMTTLCVFGIGSCG